MEITKVIRVHCEKCGYKLYLSENDFLPSKCPACSDLDKPKVYAFKSKSLTEAEKLLALEAKKLTW